MRGPAVILMAYGSPDRLADVPAYYADIRGGRPIAAEHLDDLVARYRGLGIDDSDAPSPLNAITEETRAALERELGLSVLTGMRHWDPRIAAAVDALGRPLRAALSRSGRRPRRDPLRPPVGGGARLRRPARPALSRPRLRRDPCRVHRALASRSDPRAG